MWPSLQFPNFMIIGKIAVASVGYSLDQTTRDICPLPRSIYYLLCCQECTTAVTVSIIAPSQVEISDSIDFFRVCRDADFD